MRKFLTVVVIVASVGAVLLAPSYIRYRRGAGVMPPGVRLGGIEINGGSEAEVIAGLNRLFGEPVALYYGDQRILLRPQAVGFQVDTEAMLQAAEAYNTFPRLVRFLVGRALDRLPPPVDVPVRYTVDQIALDNWLADVGRRYDREPGPPRPILETLTIAPGQPGQQLDLAASREQVIAALTDPQNRTAHLVLRETPPLPVDMNALAELLRARLEQFPGIASVYLHHIPTGEEIAINADVAYAGMSTMKIAILTELYRKLNLPPGVETTKLITETTSLSGNFTANLLLGIIDDGSPDAGVRILNDSLRKLGIKNTFMATPYDRKQVTPPRIVTEANSRTDLNTRPDPYMQTTPRDMGTVLQMLVECSQGGGTLLAAYPGQYTASECQQALDFLALNEVKALITAGVPKGTRVVHKHGYVPDTHGDVAAIWGPDGPYILSVFLYRPPWLEWQLSDGTMREISQAVWNYFTMTSASR
jgi:beta-lactamase class A